MGCPLSSVFSQSDARKGSYSASFIFFSPWAAHFFLYSVNQMQEKEHIQRRLFSLAHRPPTSFCFQSVSYKKRSIFSFVYFPEPKGCPLPFVFSQSDARKGAYSASYIFLSPWAANFLLYSVSQLQEKEHIQRRLFSWAHGPPTSFCIQSIRCKKRGLIQLRIFSLAHGLPTFFCIQSIRCKKGAYSASFIFLSPRAAHFLLYSVNQMQEKEHIQLRIFSWAHRPPTSFCFQSVSYKKRSIFSVVYFP